MMCRDWVMGDVLHEPATAASSCYLTKFQKRKLSSRIPLSKLSLDHWGFYMSMNWFEGGRRISALFAGIVILGGAAFSILAGSNNDVILETTSPNDRFHWTLKQCRYPDTEKDWTGKVEFHPNDARTVSACFRANKDGKLWYAEGPEQKLQLPTPEGRKSPPPPFIYRGLLQTEIYTPEADTYMAERMKTFKLSRAEFDAIADDQWMIGWVRFWDRVKEAMPWVAGLLLAVWFLTSVLGWVVRGFASIPTGRDFRADHPEFGNLSRSSNSWIGGAIATSVVLGGLAWGIGSATGAVAPKVGGLVAKLLGGLGTIFAVLVFFGFGAAGGWGLLTLFYKLGLRDAGEQDEKGFIAAAIFNGFIVMLLSVPINKYTPVGGLIDNLDKWSRVHGYADGATMAVFSVCLLWPYIALSLINKFYTPKIDNSD
jgi:hypothetical protein